MPVWHELTRGPREAGELRVLGIVQEQHRERALLYRNWKGYHWPILWDPFNITGSRAVLNVVFIDEHGIVRKVGPRPARFLEECLGIGYPAPDPGESEAPGPGERLVELDDDSLDGVRREHAQALSDLLWRTPGKMDAAVATLARHARAHPDRAPWVFQAGVAHRLRCDSPAHRPDDFQRAVDRWSGALALDPNQYIWRRRLQQYGPRSHQPYPFYNWVDEALAELGEGGAGIPPGFDWSLTPAERAVPRRGGVEPAAPGPEPDPQGRIQRTAGDVACESAVVLPSDGDSRVASVHLAFRPAAEREVRWNNAAGPLELWIDEPDPGDGWTLDVRHLEHRDPRETSNEVRRFHVELDLPAGVEEAELTGYALFHVCAGADGTCVYRRLDFTVPVHRPD